MIETGRKSSREVNVHKIKKTSTLLPFVFQDKKGFGHVTEILSHKKKIIQVGNSLTSMSAFDHNCFSFMKTHFEVSLSRSVTVMAFWKEVTKYV